MKINFLFVLNILCILIAQDRSIIFNAPPGMLEEGFEISYQENGSNSVADRFYLSNDYILEGVSLWLYPDEATTISVEVYEDSLGLPGTSIYETSLAMFASESYQEYYISTVADCIDLSGGQYYWLSLKVSTEGSSVSWQYSMLNNYYTTSDNNGEDWNDVLYGSIGATSIRGEQIYTYSQGFPDGDVNSDYSSDVLDVVLTVGYILGNEDLTDSQQDAADLNRDNSIDILDIVILVELILEGPAVMPDFTLLDINPNSEFYGEYIGPSDFEGQVSGYYFGKAG